MQNYVASMANQTVMAGLNLPMHFIADMLDNDSLRRLRLASTQCASYSKHLAVPNGVYGKSHIRFTPANGKAVVRVPKTFQGNKQGHSLPDQLLEHISKLGLTANHVSQLLITSKQHTPVHIELSGMASSFTSLRHLVLDGAFQSSVYQELFRQLSAGMGQHLQYLALRSVDSKTLTLLPSDILVITQHASNLIHLELPWTPVTMHSVQEDTNSWLGCLSSFSRLTTLHSLTWSIQPPAGDSRFLNCLMGTLQTLPSLRTLTSSITPIPAYPTIHWVMALSKLKQLRDLNITIHEDASQVVGKGLTAMMWLDTLKITFNDWAVQLQHTQQHETALQQAVTCGANRTTDNNSQQSHMLVSPSDGSMDADHAITDQLLSPDLCNTDRRSVTEEEVASTTLHHDSSSLQYHASRLIALQKLRWTVTSCTIRVQKSVEKALSLQVSGPQALQTAYHDHFMNSIAGLFGVSYVQHWSGFPHLASLQIHLPISTGTAQTPVSTAQQQYIQTGDTVPHKFSDFPTNYSLDLSMRPDSLQELRLTRVTLAASTAGGNFQPSMQNHVQTDRASEPLHHNAVRGSMATDNDNDVLGMSTCDQMMAMLPSGLKTLVLMHCHLEGVSIATSIPRNLLQLSLQHCTQSNPEQHTLATTFETCPYLETLEIHGTRCITNTVSSADWQALKTKALNVRHLDLWSTGEGWISTNVGDEDGVPVIANLTQLTHLAFTWGLENRPLSWLAGLPQLQSLRITLTRAAVGPCSGFGKALLRERAQQSLEYVLPNTAINVSLV